MVLNQNEYTIASLGFKYLKPPLFLPKQTCPPSFLINKIELPPPLDHTATLFPSPFLSISPHTLSVDLVKLPHLR